MRAIGLFSCCLMLAILPAAFAQNAEKTWTIKDGQYRNSLYGFGLRAATKDWKMEGGDAARSKAGASAEVFFSRAGNSARGHCEVVYNPGINASKYMEQLHDVYGQGTNKLSSKKARLKCGPAVINIYEAKTQNNTAIYLYVVATGGKAWKLGFMFSCPKTDFAKFRREFDATLNSVKLFKPTIKKLTARSKVDGTDISYVIPNAYWFATNASYWSGPAGVVLSLTRKPHAAYSLLGTRAAPEKDLKGFSLSIATEISKLNQNGNDKVKKKVGAKAIKVAGTRGIQAVYENRSVFPFTVYVVTVWNRGGKAHWFAQWCLPENYAGFKKDMSAIVGSLAHGK